MDGIGNNGPFGARMGQKTPPRRSLASKGALVFSRCRIKSCECECEYESAEPYIFSVRSLPSCRLVLSYLIGIEDPRMVRGRANRTEPASEQGRTTPQSLIYQLLGLDKFDTNHPPLSRES